MRFGAEQLDTTMLWATLICLVASAWVRSELISTDASGFLSLPNARSPRFCANAVICAGVVVMVFAISPAFAQCAATSCVVTSSADTLNGNSSPTLRDAIIYANANPGTRITFASAISGQTITLTSELPLILGNHTVINGASQNITISGADAYRVFFIGGAGQAGEPASTAATIENLTISHGNAVGGNGSFQGGGGAGLGGAVFVSSTGSLTAANVTLSSNAATGGNGGNGLFGGGTGAGGGMGGNAGSSCCNPGAGGFGRGATGGDAGGGAGGAGAFTGGSSAGSGGSGYYTGGTGGVNGGGGGGGSGAGGGGGGVGGAGAPGGFFGGSGGFGGGGGAEAGGNGGFGGGGGASGNGGFGGGGGGTGVGGFGGGAGISGSPGGGGGGAGLGGAVFVQQGGALTLAGAFVVNGNSVTAGSAGNVGAANGTAFGSGLFLQGNGTVSFSPINGQTQTVSDAIADQVGSGGNGANAGSWALNVSGGGTLVLDGVNSYSGDTTVTAATLVVNGSIGDPTINAGGVLTGSGVIGSTQIKTGATFAPGNGTPGTSMTVAGSLTFASGAHYQVQISTATSSFTQVTGAAMLGGATVYADYASGSYVAKQYTILSATGGVSGAFGSVVNSNLPSGFNSTLSYDGFNAFLNVSWPSFSGLNVNQQAVADALTRFFNATGGIPMAFGTLSPGGLSQISGETATGAQQTTFDAMNLFMGVMTDPLVNGRGDGATGQASTLTNGVASDPYATLPKAPSAVYDPHWNVWAASFGGSENADGHAMLGSNSTTSSIYGAVVGADYHLSPYTLAGFALGGGGADFSVAGSGSGHSDLFQTGGFIRHAVGAAYISSALAYGWQEITTNRSVNAAGSDQLRAQFNPKAFSGRLEGGYRFVIPSMGGIGITPYAAGQSTTFALPAYAEQALVGSNAFALAYNAKDVTDSRSELGIRTDESWAMIDGILTLRARAAWAHDYDPDRLIGAAFQTLPGASFVVNGAAQAADLALVTASVEQKWLNGLSAMATFEGEFSNVTRSYAGKGVVRYQW